MLHNFNEFKCKDSKKVLSQKAKNFINDIEDEHVCILYVCSKCVTYGNNIISSQERME